MSSVKSHSILRARLLNQAVGAWLFGGPAPKFNGNHVQIEAAVRVAFATKNFKETLDKKNVSVEEVMNVLHEKHVAALYFKRVFNAPWLL